MRIPLCASARKRGHVARQCLARPPSEDVVRRRSGPCRSGTHHLYRARRAKSGHRRTAHGQKHRSEEHTSELQSLMRISYAVFCLKKKKNKTKMNIHQREKCTQKEITTTVATTKVHRTK